MSPQELTADEETTFDRAVRDWAEERVAARRAARERRDFATSDAIRKELESRGIEIKDTAFGTQWKKVR